MICPVCSNKLTAKQVRVSELGDFCSMCLAPIVVKKTKGGYECELDKARLDADGYYITISNERRTIKKATDSEKMFSYIVVLSDFLFTNGNLYCPECGGYLGNLRLNNGTYESKTCNNTSKREEVKNARCKARTKFIFRGHNLDNLPVVRSGRFNET